MIAETNKNEKRETRHISFAVSLLKVFLRKTGSSGNEIATRVLAETPDRFNWDWEDNETDKRSDDKGAEPETVEILNIANQRYILFVGLERNSQVMVYDITNPVAPQFLQFLQRGTDYAPEGVLAITAEDSPTGKALVIISYEDSGTVSIYENEN